MGTKNSSVERITYSVLEVSEMLGISRTYAYQLSKQEAVPSIRIGNRIFFPKKEFDAYIESLYKG